MTQERFHRLLDNPELLTTIPYEEMKTLVLTYPYAHNLRYLLALKAHQDEHPDAERMLNTAAVYSLDRTQLFHLTAIKIPSFQPLTIMMEEAVLELKPIEEVQRELEALAPQTRPEKVETATFAPPPPSPPTETKPPEKQVISEAPKKPPLPPSVAREPFAAWIARFNPPSLTVAPRQGDITPAATEAPPAPNRAPTSPPEEKPHTGLSAQELAERSVAENKDVISETLARLLAKQGYRDKAINMYERLRLAFPEKSAYFAAEIEKLKK